MTRPFAARLRRDRRGATLVEFGMVAPVMILLLIGAMDVGHTLYVTAVLQGEVQTAARASSLETNTLQAQQDAVDAQVRDQVRTLVGPGATIRFGRRFYRTFADAAAARAETYRDLNGNKRCDDSEPFDDQNWNGVWDSDGADAGQGGAKDRTLYTVTVTYPDMFPLWRFIGLPETQTIAARTILENQPYNDQGSYAATPKAGTCP